MRRIANACLLLAATALTLPAAAARVPAVVLAFVVLRLSGDPAGRRSGSVVRRPYRGCPPQPAPLVVGMRSITSSISR